MTVSFLFFHNCPISSMILPALERQVCIYSQDKDHQLRRYCDIFTTNSAEDMNGSIQHLALTWGMNVCFPFPTSS